MAETQKEIVSRHTAAIFPHPSTWVEISPESLTAPGTCCTKARHISLLKTAHSIYRGLFCGSAPLITEPSRARSAAEFEVRLLSGLCAVSIDNGGALQPRSASWQHDLATPQRPLVPGLNFKRPRDRGGRASLFCIGGTRASPMPRHITVSRRP